MGPAQAPAGLSGRLQHHPLLLRSGELEHQRDLQYAVVVRRRPVEHHAAVGIHLQRLLRGRLDRHPGRLIGDDLHRALRTLRDRPSLGVVEAEAPASRLRERQRTRELPMTGALRQQLHGGAVHDRGGFHQVAVGTRGDEHLRAARGAQIARRAFFRACREPGVLRVQVRHRQIADDGRHLGRGGGRIASAQARQPQREPARRNQLEDARDDQRSRENGERQPRARERQLLARVERARLRRRAYVEEREQVARDARLFGGARQLDAGEKVRRADEEPCQRDVIANPGALYGRAHGEDDHRRDGCGKRDGADRTRDDGGRERPDEGTNADRDRGTSGDEGGGSQCGKRPGPAPRPAQQRVDLAARLRSPVGERAEPGRSEPP